MLQGWSLFLVSAAYVALLFGIAHYGDRVRAFGRVPAHQPWIYSLALGVYCTSWTFYGAVGRTVASGWDFLPIYLGPLLVFVFGQPLLARIVAVSKRHNITSIADFIGARYGRQPLLAMGVTLIAVLGVLPYIALQLKAVAFGFEVLAAPPVPGDGLGLAFGDSALVVAVLLAVFAILFGTRQVVSSESHHGMVLAIAFESVIKLVAFLAVGLYACYGVFEGFGDAYAQSLVLPQLTEPLRQADWHAGFWTQTLLAAIAIVCLPRQFHVAVVESTSPRDLTRARWVFPLYLVLISLFVVPIAAAGLAKLPAGTAADTYVLALPLAGGHGALALAAYLGGFSAATGMVIVETIALSTMLSNEVVMPALLRSRRFGLSRQGDLSGLLKRIRRIAIVAIIAAAYLYYRLFTGPGTLSALGLLSFAAVAQFAPAVVGGLVWRGGSHRGAVAGLVAGFVVWAWCLLLPALLGASGAGAALLAEGPFGIAALRPQALFGLEGLDPVAHGTLWSLAANLCGYLLVSRLAQPRLAERLQAAQFLAPGEEERPVTAAPVATPATVGDLLALLERFLGADAAQAQLAEFAAQRGKPLAAEGERADRELLRFTEHLLAGALGTASARLLLASTLRGRDMQPEDVIRLLDETSHAIVFSQERLRGTLEHLSQGVSVVDRDLRLVAWNRRYLELFRYPPELIHVGQPIETLFRHNAARGLLGAGDAETLVARRMEHLVRGTPYLHERQLPDGSVIEIRGTPMPGGGFVTSYADVSAHKQAQRQLEEANETLESRVAERTAELAEAKAEAERANAAKTRFLAAASHDLVQPLHAARLFLSAADRDALPAASAGLLDRIGDSLQAAEQLLSGLLDISRLDAGALPVRREHFPSAQVLTPLAREFEALAATRGLRFRYRASGALLHSDPALLRRVLQNFLGNAVRYTRQGGVLLGLRRRRGGALRIEVWDSGPGIPAAQQREIFEEFRRLQAQDAGGERGLGLGLAIAERAARLLGHPLTLRSVPGRGSMFAITVPAGVADGVCALPVPAERAGAAASEATILVLDNEPLALAALAALLERWGHRVLPAASGAEAEALVAAHPPPALLLVDYHLDDGESGIAVAARLRARWNAELPCVVITADPTREARDAAAEQGHALLQKPVKPAALRALLQRLLPD